MPGEADLTVSGILQLAEIAGDRGTVDAPPMWSHPRGVFGGFTASLALATAAWQTQLETIAAAQVMFAHPVESGPIEVAVELVRRGRASAAVHVRVRQDELDRVLVQAWLVDGPIEVGERESFHIPRPDSCPVLECFDGWTYMQAIDERSIDYPVSLASFLGGPPLVDLWVSCCPRFCEWLTCRATARHHRARRPRGRRRVTSASNRALHSGIVGPEHVVVVYRTYRVATCPRRGFRTRPQAGTDDGHRVGTRWHCAAPRFSARESPLFTPPRSGPARPLLAEQSPPIRRSVTRNRSERACRTRRGVTDGVRSARGARDQVSGARGGIRTLTPLAGPAGLSLGLRVRQ